jgi:hypothetical protein
MFLRQQWYEFLVPEPSCSWSGNELISRITEASLFITELISRTNWMISEASRHTWRLYGFWCCKIFMSERLSAFDFILAKVQPVEIHLIARELKVTDKDASEKERAEVQKTMLGPEVLDSDSHQEIVFKSTAAEPNGAGRWTLHGNLTLRGQTRPVSVQVTVHDGRYTGETTVKQTDFGITPPGKAGVRAKDEVKIEFDVRLT